MNTRHTLQALNQAITTLEANKHKLPATLRQLADHQDTGLKATNYDTAGGTTSGHSDPTTGTTLDRDEHAELVRSIATVLITANRINDLIANNDPDRTINTCSTCGDALESRAAAFCTRCVNAKADQAAEQAKRHCSNPACARPMGKNEPLRNGRCNACDCHHRQHGTERLSAATLTIQDGVIVAPPSIT